MFCAHNIFYCPDYLETKSQELCDEIMVPMHYFHTLIGEFNNEEVLYITVRNTVNTATYLATMGVPHESDPHTVYMPLWMMNALGVTDTTLGCIELEKTVGVEFIPVATKIVLRDPQVEEVDVCELVENAMVNLHSIQQGVELPIWVEDMERMVYIERIEPGAVSRIIAGDVEVEFVMPSITPSITPSAVPSAVPSAIDIDSEPIIGRIPSVPSVPRASSLLIANAWDYYEGEERQKYIREARLKRFS